MSEHALKLNGYITRPEFWALDEACKPLRSTFPDYGPYLVGSVMERPTFRDVDVRLILTDEQYDRLTDDEWGLLGFVTSRHLATITGLPIDFQFQRHTEATAAYGHKSRTPLGMRGEGFWHGDQRPTPTLADALREAAVVNAERPRATKRRMPTITPPTAPPTTPHADDQPTVCIAHGAFIPCRKDGEHRYAASPYWVKSVRDYQGSPIDDLTWEPAWEHADDRNEES